MPKHVFADQDAGDHAFALVFVGLDGDRIGDRVTKALIDNDLQMLSSFSSTISSALHGLKDTLEQHRYSLIIETGDGFLVSGDMNVVLFRELMGYFYEFTDCTISIGIGKTLRDMYLALKFAKACGGNCIGYHNESGPCLL